MKSKTIILDLFNLNQNIEVNQKSNTIEKLKRLDSDIHLKEKLLPLCRLKYGEIWEDPIHGHRVGVLGATQKEDI